MTTTTSKARLLLPITNTIVLSNATNTSDTHSKPSVQGPHTHTAQGCGVLFAAAALPSGIDIVGMSTHEIGHVWVPALPGETEAFILVGGKVGGNVDL